MFKYAFASACLYISCQGNSARLRIGYSVGRNSTVRNFAKLLYGFTDCRNANGRTHLDSRGSLARARCVSYPRDGQRKVLHPRSFSVKSVTVGKQSGSPSAGLDVSSRRRMRMLQCAAASKRIRLSAPTMVVLEVSTPLLGAVAVASSHGLTDLKKTPRELIPYALVLMPIPSDLVTVLFISCSIQHFSRDISLRFSLLLHMVFIALSPFCPQVGWIIFSFYYCLCHAPLHFVRHASEIDFPLAVMMVTAILVSAFGFRGVEVFQLTDAMQLGVIAHIVVDELEVYRSGHTDA